MKLPRSLSHALAFLFGTKKRGTLTVLGTLLLLALLASLAGYEYVVHGGMIARQKPPAIEAFFASHLVTLGIPDDAKRRTNPLRMDANSPDVAAGRVGADLRGVGGRYAGVPHCQPRGCASVDRASVASSA